MPTEYRAAIRRLRWIILDIVYSNQTPSESHVVDVASFSNSSRLVPSSIDSSIPASRSTLPRLQARGLVNTKNICFANAVLQFLVYSSSLWNLFGELGDLKRRRGAGVPEIDGGATPLVDATEKIFKEFIVEEEPLTQQQSQLGTGGASRADEGF